MSRYKVIKHFNWGQLSFEPNQILIITPEDDRLERVTIYGSDQSIRVGKDAVQTMIQFGRVTEM